MIQQLSEVEEMCARLGQSDQVAVDTESNSLFAYREQVCLIQFSTREEDYLVDPLALTGLTSLSPLFADRGIEKIFHAAEYDLICLRRDFNFEVHNLFDTMAAARILGRSEIGLGALLEAEFGVKLEKRYQRADWGQRPLPEALLDYARLDTHYLINLRERLGEELNQRGLIRLAEEDFRRLEAITLEENGNGGNGDKAVDCWRISGAYDLSPRQAAVLLELCHWRDDAARQANRPLFKVVSNQTLLAISKELPRNLEELSSLPGMSPGQVRRYGQGLVKAVQRGMKAPEAYPPRSKRPDQAVSERMDLLREWRKQAAEEMGVPSDVVLPRDLMQCLAHSGPRSREEVEGVMISVPWRLERFGDEILGVLVKGKNSLHGDTE